MLNLLFGARSKARDDGHAIVARLYDEIVRATRQPGPYVHWGVPDTLDGRYDMLVLHAFVVFHRLGTLMREEAARAGVPETRTEPAGLSQALFNHMMRDLDTNLREAGVSDIRIGAKVKARTKAFYGRVAAYEAGLAESGDAVLRDALDRNVYTTVAAPPEGLSALVAYMRGLVAESAGWSWDDLARGTVTLEPANPIGGESATDLEGTP
ncbi:ubiquinol-cytochrome C chaperone family protein [Roseospira visakhapatnamensis]|uniref:Cytochrome b pre-mRNA-processing protein 3 n=1 Tax=Roseospira visakhapatnamensis TaxID=390880 RepID=A0A7W6WAA2_9PROT|nr:ubiquinol-cytochrome C chaperone family protein [Roseospira visakhapatnamensis]MBB4266990.1 cytochrome b pre-mRNA-processing protein 3 [Roseospira visakhapatnamensis]